MAIAGSHCNQGYSILASMPLVTSLYVATLDSGDEMPTLALEMRYRSSGKEVEVFLKVYRSFWGGFQKHSLCSNRSTRSQVLGDLLRGPQAGIFLSSLLLGERTRS